MLDVLFEIVEFDKLFFGTLISNLWLSGNNLGTIR